jgi:hypothetical protein
MKFTSRKLKYGVVSQSHREASRRLFEVAEQQQGYFTTKQAKAAGFAGNPHPYHVKVGNWIREISGVYRLALFPMTERPELVLWALWSRNRNEEVEGSTATIRSRPAFTDRLISPREK